MQFFIIIFAFLSLKASANSTDVDLDVHDVDSITKVAKAEFKMLDTYFDSLFSLLVEIEYEDSDLIGNSHAFPKSVEESERIIDMIDPSKSAFTGTLVAERKLAMSKDKNEADKLENVIDNRSTRMFRRLDLYRAIVSGITDNNWPKELKDKAIKKWLIDMQAYNLASTEYLGSLIMYASLVYAQKKGLFLKELRDIVDKDKCAERDRKMLSKIMSDRTSLKHIPYDGEKHMELINHNENLLLLKNKSQLNQILTKLLMSTL